VFLNVPANATTGVPFFASAFRDRRDVVWSFGDGQTAKLPPSARRTLRHGRYMSPLQPGILRERDDHGDRSGCDGARPVVW
jgi:hypothetical protein